MPITNKKNLTLFFSVILFWTQANQFAYADETREAFKHNLQVLDENTSVLTDPCLIIKVCNEVEVKWVNELENHKFIPLTLQNAAAFEKIVEIPGLDDATAGILSKALSDSSITNICNDCGCCDQKIEGKFEIQKKELNDLVTDNKIKIYSIAE